jgi:hypothetical protein
MPTPQQREAYRLIQSAYGRSVVGRRPDNCEQCGLKPEYEALQGHHDDYSKPLEVRWLCRSCHQRHHDALKPRKKRSVA